MEELYNDLAAPSGLASVKRLYDYIKNKKDVKDYLKTQDSYTLHKPVVRKFKRRKYVVKGRDDLVQIDLADVSNLAQFNGGVKYLLVWIDCYSRFLRVEPLKNKFANSVTVAIQKLIAAQKPQHIQSDKGTEFRNQMIQKIFEENGINYYTTQDPDTKAAFAERVIRTLKGNIYRYMTLKNTKRYINVLQQLVQSYNRSKHRSLGLSPIAVADGQEPINRKKSAEKIIRFKFNVGERVRIALEKTTFARGYTPNWSTEFFYIAQQLHTNPPTYKIEDANNEPIIGSYYEPELQSV
jgi:transposase InsO family protein